MTAVEFAIKMELEGEQYYLEQSEKTEHPGLKAVFILLAAEEREHATILEHYAAQTDYELRESQVPGRFKGVFENEKDFRVELKTQPEELDAYKLALKKEKESIELYKKMGSEASSEQEKKLFEFLVEQETIHYNTFQELIEHVIKAEQWVESAEFGLREEY